MGLHIPKLPSDCGRRLLPTLIDSIADENPKRPFLSIPKSLDLQDGFGDVSYGTFARAVNRCSWSIERVIGRSETSKTILYLGPLDIRYLIVLFAAVKTGHKAFFSSSRNSLKAHLSLLNATQCHTILLPNGAPVITRQILAMRPMQILSMPDVEFFLSDNGDSAIYPYEKTFDEVKNEALVVLHTSGSTGIPKPIYTKHGTLASHDAYQLISSQTGKHLFEDLLRGKRFLVAFPLFHAANLGCTLAYNIYCGVTCVIPPPVLLTAKVVDMIHTYGNVSASVLPPSILIDIFNNSQYFDNMVQRLEFVSYNGGSLAKNIGDLISSRIRIRPMFGSTETWLFPIEVNDVASDWQYLRISPLFGHEYRPYSEGLYEHVNVRQKQLELYQGVFSTFPDLQEYPMSDLYAKHSSRPGYWIYRGRTDDIITFSNAEKLNPVTMEGIISSHPSVNAAIIGGHGKFQSSLLIEPKVNPKTNEERKELLNDIWPAVELANIDCPIHGRIMKSHLIFTSAEKPMPRAGKGTVQRNGCLQLYEKEIDALYTYSPILDSIPEPRLNVEVFQLKSLRDAIYSLVSSSACTTLNGNNLEEVHRILAAAIASKLSTLIAIDSLGINLNQSIAELGMDSLIVIELKKWIAEEFLANMQTSEILDQANMMELATVIASRSKVVEGIFQDILHQYKLESLDRSKTSKPESTPELFQVDGNHEQNLQAKPITQPSTLDARLPRLPLPHLADTMLHYLTSIRSLCSEEEFMYTSKQAKQFQQPGGPGQRAHRLLAERKSESENWLLELYTLSIHLNSRFSLHPFDMWFGSHLLGSSSSLSRQAERATVISAEAFKFKQLLESGQLTQDIVNEQPLCMELHQWLFNTTREPHIGSDKMRKYPNNDFLIALRKGHVFKVLLRKNQKNITFSRLEACFQEILIRTQKEVPAICTLTADERDSWTKFREIVKSSSPSNATLISTVEASAFVLCLDDASPNNSLERYTQFLLSGGSFSNRWADKPLQFVVCQNGASAYIAEHSMLDGSTLTSINEYITRAIINCKPTSDLDMSREKSAQLPIEELHFTSTATLDAHINRVQDQFCKSINHVECAPFTYSHYGSHFLRSFKCPPKTGFQLILQLAALVHFGYHPASWETVSMRQFHKGRVEICQTVIPPVASFCAAVQDDKIPMAKRRELFFEAAKAHANMVTRASRGRGGDRYLSALKQVIGENEPLPEFFKDPVYCRTRPGKMMTDCSEMLSLEVGSVMGEQEPDTLWIHYEVKETSCHFSIVGTSGRTKSFLDALEVAGKTIWLLLEGS